MTLEESWGRVLDANVEVEVYDSMVGVWVGAYYRDDPNDKTLYRRGQCQCMTSDKVEQLRQALVELLENPRYGMPGEDDRD